MVASSPLGFYGKVPDRGDFVRRRLPDEFVQPWDEWIQSAVMTSQNRLGEQWLDIYLTSPIWRFALSPGNCNDLFWTGVIMPSVDKAGRCFPLTIAASVPGVELPFFFFSGLDWFSKLEDLALSTLDEAFDLDAFDLQLRELPPPAIQSFEMSCPEGNCDGDNGRLVFHSNLKGLQTIQHAVFGLIGCLLSRFSPKYTLWATTGSDLVSPSFLVCDGLPNSLSDLMTGQWSGVSTTASGTWLVTHPPMPLSEAMPPTPTEKTTPPKLQWYSSARSDAGKLRTINEDAYLELPELGVWAVADGMGGHSAGDAASQAVVEALASLSKTDTIDALIVAAEEKLQIVNAKLLAMAKRKGPTEIIGTTIVTLLAVYERCAVIWAGDSRLYRYRKGVLTQMTDDHSLVNDFSRQSILPNETPSGGNIENIVTRAVGAGPELLLDTIHFKAQIDDRYLLCCDGLFKEMDHREISEILSRGQCNDCSQNLIDLALERGARDNVTVIVVDAVTNHPSMPIEGNEPR